MTRVRPTDAQPTATPQAAREATAIAGAGDRAMAASHAPTVAGAHRWWRSLLLLALAACAPRLAPPPPPPPPLASPGTAPASGVNLPPTLTVSSNVSAGEVRYGTVLSLAGACTDREDGPMGAIRWSTDDGHFLGEGPTLRYMPEPGSFLILATCTDRQGWATTQAATTRLTVVDRWTSVDSIPVLVTLPYMTNRPGAAGAVAPGGASGGGAPDTLSRGVVTVNVPAGDFRRAGEASRTPFMRSLRGNIVSSDATRLSIRGIEPLDSLTLDARLRGALAQAPEGDVLVFVHGYNTSFEGAATRAARLIAGLQYPGALVLFSWPSDGALASYRLDQQAARDAGVHLARTLAELRDVAGVRRVSVVVHSMGGEVLAAALRALDARRVRLGLGDVVFIAPDLAAGEFVQDVLPSLRERASRVTVYASAADFALWSSWGSNGERRLGLGGRFATLARGVETVEIGYDDTDSMGHNPFASDAFRDDLHRLLVQGLGAPQRGLAPVTRQDGAVMWRLR